MKTYSYLLAILLTIVFTGCFSKHQVSYAIEKNNLPSFIQKIKEEPELLDEKYTRLNMGLLQYSISVGNYDIANYLIDNNLVKNINEKASFGFNASYYLAGNGYRAPQKSDIAFAEKLFSKGLTIKNDLNKNDENLLNFFCKYKEFKYINKEMLKLFIDKGLNVNNLDKWKETPLYTCMMHANTDIAQFLIDNGADANLSKNILKIAMNKPYLKSKHSPERYADINYEPAIIFAAKHIDSSRINVIDKDGNTLLHLLAQYNTNPELIEKYAKAGHNINLKNKDGYTALQIALSSNGNVKTVLTLIENGANIKDVYNGRTIASYLIDNHNYWKEKKIAVENIFKMIKKGSIVNNDSFGKLLMLVSHTNSKSNIDFILNRLPYNEKYLSEGLNEVLPKKEIKDSTILYLIKKGATHAVNRYGFHTLVIAIGNRDVKIMKALIANGVNIHKKDKYRFSPIVYAVRFGSIEHTKYLIKKGANYLTKDDYGYNLLHIAAIFNKPEQMQLLINKGLDVNSKTNNSETIFHLMYKPEKEHLFSSIISYYNTVFTNAKIDAGIIKNKIYKKRIIDILIKNKANINEANKGGETVAHYFLNRYYPESDNKAVVATMNYLIKAGLDINKPNKFGLMPWYYQTKAKIQHGSLQKLLIKKGAKVNNYPVNNIRNLRIASSKNLEWDFNQKKGAHYITAPNGQLIEEVQLRTTNGIGIAEYTRYDGLGRIIMKYIANSQNYNYEYIAYNNDSEEIMQMTGTLSHYYFDQYGAHLGFALTEMGYLEYFPKRIKFLEKGKWKEYSFPSDYNKISTTKLTFNGATLYEDSSSRWRKKSEEAISKMNNYLDDPRENEYQFHIRKLGFYDEGVMNGFSRGEDFKPNSEFL